MALRAKPVSREAYLRLLAAYRAKPGAHAHAARLAGIAVNTARKAWFDGLKAPAEARTPITEQLARETSSSGDVQLAPAAGRDLVARVNAARMEALELAQKARRGAGALADAVEKIAPGLLAAADRAAKALDELRERPPEGDPQDRAIEALDLLRRGAIVARYASLVSKSTMEAERAIVEAIRVPFAIAPTDSITAGDSADDELDEQELAAQARAFVDRVDRKHAGDGEGDGRGVPSDGSQEDTAPLGDADAPR